MSAIQMSIIQVINCQLSRCCTARGPVSRYYWVVPPRWGLVSSVLFTIVPIFSYMKQKVCVYDLWLTKRKDKFGYACRECVYAIIP